MSITVLVGGVNICFKTSESKFSLGCPPAYIPYINYCEPDFTFSIKLGKPDGVDFAQPSFRSENISYYQSPKNTTIRLDMVNKPNFPTFYTAVFPLDSNNGYLYLENPPLHNSNSYLVNIPPGGLDEILAIHLLARIKGLMFHSCGIKLRNGFGLLFAGISGAGKTTSIDLWRKSGKAILLGDERLIVIKKEGKFFLQSTVWHDLGETPALEQIPLEKIFILEHNDNNLARLLKPTEAVTQLIVRAFLPFWDRKGMEDSLCFLEDLTNCVPCYQFGFTPNQSAVDFVECLVSS